MRPLGPNQLAWLWTVRDNKGRYYDGCGMTWNGPVGTQRLCESLEKRGLLMRRSEKFSTYPGFTTFMKDVWHLTDEGRAILMEPKGNP